LLTRCIKTTHLDDKDYSFFVCLLVNLTRDNKRCWDPEGMLIYCCAMRSSTSSAIRTGKFCTW
jgi:hypothetical protein